MFDTIRARLRQGYRTMDYPVGPPPAMPDRFAGRPAIRAACPDDCSACNAVCPTGAFSVDLPSPSRPAAPQIDLGRCLFCRACEAACPHRAIQFTPDFRLAATRRESLIVRQTILPSPRGEGQGEGPVVLGESQGEGQTVLPSPRGEGQGEGQVFPSPRGQGQGEGSSSAPSAPAPISPAAPLFRRSLKLRQVSAGGCNACEADCNVLSTLA
ncbi:MAG: 4Fe-4S dicluster domain-containing protein, partial [Phycisphaerae bacterium]|nr:4Fe-4S dicluster domain-containing protein [Phycisphaerae bacterium]